MNNATSEQSRATVSDPGAPMRTVPICRAHSARAEVAVLRAAQALEDNHALVRGWYGGDAITELGGFTARELVNRGKGRLVLELLRAIRMGERDERP
jgi:hypothetical protein